MTNKKVIFTLAEAVKKARFAVIFVALFSIFSMDCANQKSGCPEKEEKVSVETMAMKNAPLTYQIELTFSTRMEGHYSFLPPRDTKVMKTFWKDNHFNIIVKAKSEVNSLSFAINPKGYEDGFKTNCGTILPNQVISVKVKEMKK